MTKYITETSEDYSLVDKNTGEVLEYKQTKKITIDEFIMVFFASYPELFKLKGVTLKVLMCCWKMSTYNPANNTEGNVINNNALFKSYCKSQGLQTTDANIDNAVSELSKRNLLIKICRGAYLLNPNYFFKGSLSDRSKIDIYFKVEPLNKENYKL